MATFGTSFTFTSTKFHGNFVGSQTLYTVPSGRYADVQLIYLGGSGSFVVNSGAGGPGGGTTTVASPQTLDFKPSTGRIYRIGATDSISITTVSNMDINVHVIEWRPA